MTAWIDDLKTALATRERCLLVTMTQVKGSTPREPGAKMVVWDDGFAGSIGGGKLEFAAQARARARLETPEAGGPSVERFALGPSLGQCCGGSTSLLYEVLDRRALDWIEPLATAAAEGRDAILASALEGPVVAKAVIEAEAGFGAALPEAAEAAARRMLREGERGCRVLRDSGARVLLEPLPEALPSVALFGAGHVGQAMIRVLAGLAFRVLWIDERPGLFPERPPPGVTLVPAAAPAQVAERLPAGAYALVMTHSHERDYEICERLLRRGDFAYLGLIASDTKRARCLSRMRDLGIPEAALARLTSPIGVPGIDGKLPAEIAVAVAAQLLQVRDAPAAAGETTPAPALIGSR